MTDALTLPHGAQYSEPQTGVLAIETRGLAKSFRRETALQGVDLRVPQGAVYVLAGANGAGKSTLLKILMNLERSDEGTASVLGLDPRRNGPLVRAQIGYVPESGDMGYRWMRVGQWLAHQAAYHGGWDHDYVDTLCRRLDIRQDRKLGHLSKGQARRVQLVSALAHRPAILLLDEPTDGLDPVARDEVLGLIAEYLADTGCTVLVSTHLVYEVDGLADHVGVLCTGRLIAQLSRDDLHRTLRLYRAEGPEGWVGPADLTGVLRRSTFGREIHWIVRGDEKEIAARIVRSGGTVRDVSPLSLDESVVNLMRAELLS